MLGSKSPNNCELLLNINFLFILKKKKLNATYPDLKDCPGYEGNLNLPVELQSQLIKTKLRFHQPTSKLYSYSILVSCIASIFVILTYYIALSWVWYFVQGVHIHVWVPSQLARLGTVCPKRLVRFYTKWNVIIKLTPPSWTYSSLLC